MIFCDKGYIGQFVHTVHNTKNTASGAHIFLIGPVCILTPFPPVKSMMHALTSPTASPKPHQPYPPPSSSPY